MSLCVDQVSLLVVTSTVSGAKSLKYDTHCAGQGGEKTVKKRGVRGRGKDTQRQRDRTVTE